MFYQADGRPGLAAGRGVPPPGTSRYAAASASWLTGQPGDDAPDLLAVAGEGLLAGRVHAEQFPGHLGHGQRGGDHAHAGQQHRGQQLVLPVLRLQRIAGRGAAGRHGHDRRPAGHAPGDPGTVRHGPGQRGVPHPLRRANPAHRRPAGR